MIVINAGMIKSGSTYLFRVQQDMIGLARRRSCQNKVTHAKFTNGGFIDKIPVLLAVRLFLINIVAF